MPDVTLDSALLPPDDELRRRVAEILAGQDLATLSLKVVRARLETALGYAAGALDGQRDKLKEVVTGEIVRMTQASAASPSSAASSPPPSSASASSASAPSAPARGKAKAKAASAAPAASEPEAEAPDSPAASNASEGKGAKKGAGKKDGEGTKKRQASLMSRGEFLKKAKQFKIRLGDKEVSAPARTFSSNSCGWFVNTKVPTMIDGKEVIVQCSVNMTVIGSKEWSD
eukprot:TRINITY_DN24809_c0_g1_i2.p1 TRINITY_DN24809_c0_g1~~TRINITY_DN24809_c0_g1_i2.p1  ORF type:complete len:229 (-),score=65.56 TRINITY_DN24809_c0_g1_i2:159-845(-)